MTFPTCLYFTQDTKGRDIYNILILSRPCEIPQRVNEFFLPEAYPYQRIQTKDKLFSSFNVIVIIFWFRNPLGLMIEYLHMEILQRFCSSFHEAAPISVAIRNMRLRVSAQRSIIAAEA